MDTLHEPWKLILNPTVPTLPRDIETLEPAPWLSHSYVVGVRGYCGSLHHMVITAPELGTLLDWPLWAADALRGTVPGEGDGERPTVGAPA